MKHSTLSKLQKELGYEFKNTQLLVTALTHSSYANESKNSGAQSNERLEFLGDSILGMTVAELIYKIEPVMQEGKMTKLRAQIVCEKSLAAFAVKMGLGELLLLGRGEEKVGGRKRPSILADAVEAIIAAIYLDGGLKQVEKLIKKHLSPAADVAFLENTDYKTALQEAVQTRSGQNLRYDTIEETGPDHMKEFTVEVSLNGKAIGRGSGQTRKEAERVAAKAALEDWSVNGVL